MKTILFSAAQASVTKTQSITHRANLYILHTTELIPKASRPCLYVTAKYTETVLL